MLIFDFIIWSPNPEIFPGIDWIEVRWYGLLFALGFILSQQIMYRIYKVEEKPQRDVDSLTLWMIVATIIGARLGHVMFYEPARYLKDPVSILKTWEGGLASHGAAAGILLGIFLYVTYLVDINPFKGRFIWKKQKRPYQSFLYVVDRIVICVALSGALIRLGNFINAEIIGLPTGSEYGVVFSSDIVERLEYMPQIDEVTISKDPGRSIDEKGHVPVRINVVFAPAINNEAAIAQMAGVSIKSILSNYEYITLHIYEPASAPLNYSTSRQPDGRYKVVIATWGIARHPAQLYESVSSFLIFLFLLYLWYRKKQNLPEGLLFGLFLVILFGLRFFYEFLKEDQVDFEGSMQLNMGQILSIPLVLAGILILANLKRLQPDYKKDKKS